MQSSIIVRAIHSYHCDLLVPAINPSSGDFIPHVEAYDGKSVSESIRAIANELLRQVFGENLILTLACGNTGTDIELFSCFFLLNPIF